MWRMTQIISDHELHKLLEFIFKPRIARIFYNNHEFHEFHEFIIKRISSVWPQIIKIISVIREIRGQ